MKKSNIKWLSKLITTLTSTNEITFVLQERKCSTIFEECVPLWDWEFHICTLINTTFDSTKTENKHLKCE